MFKYFMNQYFIAIKDDKNKEINNIDKNISNLKTNRKIDITVSIVMLIILIALSIVYLSYESQIIMLLSILILIVLFFYCTKREKQKLKQFDIHFKMYNTDLDTLKEVLKGNYNKQNSNNATNTISDTQNNCKSAECDKCTASNDNALEYDTQDYQVNWYTKNKIQFLISFGEKELNDQNTKHNKDIDSIQKYIFPIIAFVAGVIQDRASINEAISIGITCFFAF